MPRFEDLTVPHGFYWALDGDAPLAGMPYPEAFDWAAARRHGFGAVVCLTDDVVPYDSSPLVATAVELRDLWDGRLPDDPVAELDRIRVAVDVVRRFREDGTGVVVHCAGGTGRTGTVLGAVLVSEGVAGAEVVAWLDSLHRMRGRAGWPESPWQAEILAGFAR